MNRRDSVDELRAIAADSPILADVDDDALQRLADMAICHDYPKNNILFYQGDPAHDVFLVIDGKVKVSLSNEEGKEVVVDVVGPSGLVGLISAVDGQPQAGNAITICPSRLAKFEGGALLSWMRDQHAVHETLLKEFGRLVRQAYGKIGEHALMGVKERLLYALLEIAEREGETDGRVIVFTRPTHQELANRIGSSREVVSRLLKELLASELLQQEGRVIRVPESSLVLRDE